MSSEENPEDSSTEKPSGEHARERATHRPRPGGRTGLDTHKEQRGSCGQDSGGVEGVGSREVGIGEHVSRFRARLSSASEERWEGGGGP